MYDITKYTHDIYTTHKRTDFVNHKYYPVQSYTALLDLNIFGVSRIEYSGDKIL